MGHEKSCLILLVDDNPKNLQVLGNLLDEYRTAVATSGREALKFIRKIPPDLVLLDVMMPDMDGFEVCESLQASAETRSIPVIFLTAKTEAEDVVKGFRLGAVDYITKPFNPELVKARVRNHLELKRHRDRLETLVAAKVREIEARRQAEYELLAARKKMENELAIAARIQSSFLPSAFPACSEHPQFDLFALMHPAREVGGDFYDYFFVDDDTLVLIIADVSDKGIPAALYMMMTRTMFRSLTRRSRSPAAVMSEVNHLVCAENDVCMFISALVAFYNIRTGKLTLANAGHHPAVLIGKDGLPDELGGPHGMALGVSQAAGYAETDARLAPGHTLFLYTDGVTEAISPDGEMFGVERLKRLLSSRHGEPPAELLGHIDQVLTDFQQGTPFDDITLLALRRNT